MNEINVKYLAWYSRANDALYELCEFTADEAATDDWRFDWYTMWLAGYQPFDAAQKCYSEMVERSIITPEVQS